MMLTFVLATLTRPHIHTLQYPRRLMEDLLRCIFTLDPEVRITPADALRHPFLAEEAGAGDDHLCSPTPPTSTPTPTHHAPADKLPKEQTSADKKVDGGGRGARRGVLKA
jgi:serine/threonine protein kinase